MHESRKTRVLIIGLDGGDFYFLDRLIAEGSLPHLEALLSLSCKADLATTVPPITPVAWPAFYTGTHPTKHGAFAWYKVVDDRRVPVTARDVVGTKLWNYVERFDGHTAIVNGVPLTHPPDPVKGCLISAWDRPASAENYVSPAPMQRAVLERFGHISPRLPASERKDFACYKRLAFETEEQRADVTCWLMQELPWTLCVHVFPLTDQLNHEHVTHEWDDVRDAYLNADAQVGKLFAQVDENTYVMVMSDHGSRRYRKVFYLNQWLKRSGYLAWPESLPRPFVQIKGRRFMQNRLGLGAKPAKTMARAAAGLWSVLPARLKARVSSWARPRLDPHGTESLDLASTVAYSTSRYGDIYLQAEDKGLKDRLVADLLAVRDPETGELVLSQVIDMAAYYSHEYVQRGAPDLCLEFSTPDVQAYPDLDAGDRVWEVHRQEIGGDHAPLGVLTLSGPGVAEAGKLPEPAHIVDIFATVCVLLGLPVPDHVDGVPLSGLVPLLQVVPDLESPTPVSPVETEPHAPLSAQEEEQLKEQLRSLGYL
jgi:predicted AlkP superfamily phosphohydrolase/phosphomutase